MVADSCARICVEQASYFNNDTRVIAKALDILRQFNNAGIVDKPIMINNAQVWVWQNEPRKGQKTLIEPFIENYQKFNSNTGWKDDDDGWPQLMQALSHFSYHASGGSILLCDLQGGIYRNAVVITDPVIMSRNTNGFGPTDLGPTGISSFFSRHRCNCYCRAHWQRPREQVSHHRARAGTSMVLAGAGYRRAPSRSSRPMITYAEDDEYY